jgi:site-specific recombinase XerD
MNKGYGKPGRPKGFRPLEPLTAEEVYRLMDTCSRKSSLGIRDRALICMLWRGQFRLGELLAIRVVDLDQEACTVRVLWGKGQKSRVVVIDRRCVAEVQIWLERRKRLGLSGHSLLFCTLQGRPMHKHAVQVMLPRRALLAGIVKRVHAHGLRHTGASEMAAEGIPLRDIQMQLGHSNIAMTDTYIHSLNPQARILRLRAREWEQRQPMVS